MYENKPFVTYVGSENSLYYSGNSINIPDSLKQKVRALWIADGKSNEDPDRDTIKDLSGNGHDLKLSGFSFNKNSGYGKYETDFNDWTLNYSVLNKQIVTFNRSNIQGVFFCNIPNSYKVDIPSFKVNVDFTVSTNNSPAYYYWNEDGTREFIYLTKGINILPINYASKSNDSHLTGSGFHDSFCDSVTIEQVPEYQGAVVTDGVDDIIKSENTIPEILGDSTKCTVLSMMVNLDDRVSNSVNILGSRYLRNIIGENRSGKYGIFGYSSSDINTLGTIDVVNNILGDKDDYQSSYVSAGNVQDYFFVDGHLPLVGDPLQVKSKAWYWTLISNDVLTKDEIELLISYYNLDRWIRPIAYYNPKRQGLTNDNHSEFNDKLLDLSGNGYDIKLHNLSFSGGSGISAKPFETIKDYNIIPDEDRQELTIYNEFSYKVKSNTLNQYWTVQSIIRDNTSYQVTIVTDKDCYWVNSTTFINSEGNRDSIRKEYPVLANTPTQVIICGLDQFEYPEGIAPTSAVSYVTLKYTGEVTVTIIPSYKGALILDGIDDYGCTEINVPGLKDYTIISDRKWITPMYNNGGLISKTSQSYTGAFILEQSSSDNKMIHTWSFGEDFIQLNGIVDERSVVYQTKRNYFGNELSLTVNADDLDSPLYIGKIRGSDSRYSNVAIYYILLYPYSMSKFLMNRQLEKYNLNKLI